MSAAVTCESAIFAEALIEALPGIRILAGEGGGNGKVTIWFRLPGDDAGPPLVWRSTAPAQVEMPEHALADWLAYEASILNEADRDPGDEHQEPVCRDFEVWVAGPVASVCERRVGVWTAAGPAAIAEQLERAGYDPAVCRYEELVRG